MSGGMAHRMKNAFARIGALARITLRESTSLEDFEARFDGRMRALSDAKQMLVSGAVGSVELGCIVRSEEHTSELQSLMRISYAVFCLKKKTTCHQTKDNSKYNKHRQS